MLILLRKKVVALRLQASQLVLDSVIVVVAVAALRGGVFNCPFEVAAPRAARSVVVLLVVVHLHPKVRPAAP